MIFLENLPLFLEVGSAKLVHSRPFVRRLGLSAIIGVVGKHEAADFFRENPEGLLFRGHSHKPEMIDRRNNKVRFSSLSAGQTIDLTGNRPCIVTCGALKWGFVMTSEPKSGRFTCCSCR